MNLPIKNISISEAVSETLSLKELKDKSCKADVLRLDKIHPVISGNKWFKLKYHLEEALQTGHTSILTFGGAYSNHIIAAAYAAREAGLKSTGVIRGEEPKQLSHTLQAAKLFGMHLEFISREEYKRKTENTYEKFISRLENPYVIPEGGASDAGRKGCKEILQLADYHKYTHLLCAIGTGTMYLGLVNSAKLTQKVAGITVLKGMRNLLDEYGGLIENPEKNNYCKIFYEYHFGGYAKKTVELLEFMNNFYLQTGIPTDFVYTGKLMFAFMDLLGKDYFPEGSNILLIHSGGLQGNLSLPAGTLIF